MESGGITQCTDLTDSRTIFTKTILKNVVKPANFITQSRRAAKLQSLKKLNYINHLTAISATPRECFCVVYGSQALMVFQYSDTGRVGSA
jgi:hypothetical protein